MNALALLLMTACPVAADTAPVAGAPCACSQTAGYRVEVVPESHLGFFGRLRSWFHRSSTDDAFIEGVPVSQPAPVRTVAVPQTFPATITPTGARMPTTAEPPLAPAGGADLASLGR